MKKKVFKKKKKFPLLFPLIHIVVFSTLWIYDSFLKDFIYFRQRGREGEKEGETYQCVVASQASPTGDLTCKPSYVPWLGIKPATLWITVQCSIHWTTPARAELMTLKFQFNYHAYQSMLFQLFISSLVYRIILYYLLLLDKLHY